jgi:putative addiction module CopG family antidote
LNVTLKNELKDFVEERVRDGSYESEAEVVRDALRHLKGESDRPSPASLRAMLEQVQELEALATLLKGQADEMNQVNDEEILRHQMAMDRLSKFMSTLSNMLKKLSDTAESITKNLK